MVRASLTDTPGGGGVCKEEEVTQVNKMNVAGYRQAVTYYER